MQCNKSSGRFLKIRAKVSGFLIAKLEKRVEKRILVTIKSKKNTILTSGLQDLLNAFLTYMSGVTYLGTNAPSSGIVITTSSGQTFTLSFLITPTVYATSNSAIVSFTVRDDSENSYTAISEQLITQSAGYNIPIATANLQVTKQSDEILTLTWIITISITITGQLTFIPTSTPQPGGWECTATSSGCNACIENNANSLYSNQNSECSPTGLVSQYTKTNFITSTLFSDMFYNTYGTGSSNQFTSYVNTTLYIYTLYCMEYFVVGVNLFISGNESVICYPGRSYFYVIADPIYLQIYSPSETAPYIGVEIEFTT